MHMRWQDRIKNLAAIERQFHHFVRTIARNGLIVSNGVGNWFPLRTNAPAEIIHITLRRV